MPGYNIRRVCAAIVAKSKRIYLDSSLQLKSSFWLQFVTKDVISAVCSFNSSLKLWWLRNQIDAQLKLSSSSFFFGDFYLSNQDIWQVKTILQPLTHPATIKYQKLAKKEKLRIHWVFSSLTCLIAEKKRHQKRKWTKAAKLEIFQKHRFPSFLCCGRWVLALLPRLWTLESWDFWVTGLPPRDLSAASICSAFHIQNCSKFPPKYLIYVEMHWHRWRHMIVLHLNACYWSFCT